MLFAAPSAFAAGREVTKATLAFSPLSQDFSSVASNGETFATVWFTEGKVWGALADATGQRMIPGDTAVLTPPNKFAMPYLTAAGHDYVLFWQDTANSFVTNLGPNLQQGAAVPVAVPQFYTSWPAADPAVAANSTQILVAGSLADLSDDLAFVLNRDGSIAAGPFHLPGRGPSAVPMRASWSGHDFLIALATRGGVMLVRIDDSSMTQTQITSTQAWTASAASSGSETVVVWQEIVVGPGEHAVWSAVVSGTSVVNMQKVAQLSLQNGESTDVHWNGAAYIVTAGHYALRLDRNGLPLEPPVALPHDVDRSAATATAMYGISQGYDVNDVSPKLLATVAHTSGGVHDVRDEYLSMTPTEQDFPAIAADGLDFISAFVESAANRRSEAIAPLPAPPSDAPADAIDVSDTYRGGAPAIAHGASVDLVAWADQNGVYVRRVTSRGVAIDAQPIAIPVADPPFPPSVDVAWNGRSFLVVWANGALHDAMVDEKGVVSPPRQIAVDARFGPRVAWNGRLFLVVYGTRRGCSFECPGRGGTAAVRVSADGSAMDTAATTVDGNADDYLSAGNATVASDGGGFMIALDAIDGAQVVPVTTDSSLVVGPHKRIFDWFWPVSNAIRWSGSDYVLASEFSSGLDTRVATTRLTRNGQVEFRKVTATISPFTYLFAASSPAVAVNSAGAIAVLISEQSGDPALPRVHAYFDADFTASPSRPAAPMQVAATGTSSQFTVVWSAGAGADGVVIQNASGNNLAVVPASEHSRTFANVASPSIIVRAFNAGGMSDPVVVSVQAPVRRRAAH